MTAIHPDQLGEIVLALYAIETPEVLQAYSDYDQQLQAFCSPEELLVHLSETLAKRQSLAYYAAWYPSSGGGIERELITLDPRRCHPHRFRYTVGGWGIFHFQCRVLPDSLVECRIAVNSHKRAIKWELTRPEWKPVASWKWVAIQKHERRLLRILRSLSYRPPAP